MDVYAEIKRYQAEPKPIGSSYLGSLLLWRKGDIAEIIVRTTKFCCDDMRDAFTERYVGFGEYESSLNQSDTVNIYNCFPWPEGAAWYEMPISFCPFCGHAIKVTLIEQAQTDDAPA